MTRLDGRSLLLYLRRLTAVTVLAAVGVAAWPDPAAADLVDPPGSCVGTGTWHDGGFTVDSSTAERGTVIEVPRADRVSWSGEVVGVDPGTERTIAGSVAGRLPVPLGSFTLTDWAGPTTTAAASGTETYDLPSFVPAGVVFQLQVEHYEDGALYCSGAAQLRIAGGPFDSPLIWIVLAATVLFGVLLALTGLAPSPGNGQLIVGALLGLPFGWFIGLTAVMFGAVPLDSVLPLVDAVLCAGGGAVWARLSPLGRLRAAAAASRAGAA